MTKPFLIAGLCVIDSEELAIKTAETLLATTERLGIDFTFKASFDKANRTSLAAFRGPGLERGLEILARVKQTLGVKIATDIHEPWHAERAAQVADVIQIPAFLCRQTDLLIAAARTGTTVNVKRPSSLRLGIWLTLLGN
jgi:2-dehydro-3-deoxyphosphooctonate aldolase (KDO 8-P synthase)